MQHINRNRYRRTFSRLLARLCFLLIGQSAYAQQDASYIFRRITQSDGLLHTSVRTIVQDAKGYIWILTPNGLQRYDGSRFVNYPYDLTSQRGIIDTRTAALFSDKKNNCLWVIDKEIEKLDLTENKFSLYSREEILKGERFQFDHYTDSLNNSWFAGDFGILHNRPDPPLGYLSAPALAPGNSHVFYTDTLNGITWMTDYWQGLLLFDKKSGRVYTHDYNPVHDRFLQVMDKKFLTGIMKDSDDNIWLQTNMPQFYRYNTRSGKLFTYSLKDLNPLLNADDRNTTLFVESFFEDNHHTIWIGTANAGLLKYDREKDSFITIVDEEKDQKGLYYSYDIRCIFQDNDENIWLGTDRGISIFSPYRQRFRIIRHEEKNPLSLPKEEIQAVIQAKNGDILVGTWGGGITVYDSSWNFKKNIRLKGPFQYNLIWSFIQHDDGTIWIGCQHGYIHIYDPASQQIRTIHPPEMNNYTIHCMTKDRVGNIWFGLHNGKIAEWRREQNRFYSYNDGEKQVNQSFNPVVNIFFDSRERCWVGTEFGLKEFDTKRRVYSAVYVPGGDGSISARLIQGMEEYDDSTLIIGTLHGGINLFNTVSKTFSHLSTTEALSSSSVCAIKKSDDHSFWLTTDYGIFRFIAADKKFIRYPIGQGIVNAEFRLVNFYMLRSGELLAATATEIVRFQPGQMDDRERKGAGVEITGFKIFDQPLFIDSALADGGTVKLDYGQNFLTIGFSLLRFFNQQQVNYFYKLSGVDGDWVSAGTKQAANYTNLEPGDYTFSVKAENGDKTTGITSFKIAIIPPFWKTWWFTGLAILITLMVISGLVRKRIQAIKRQAGLKQKLVEAEMLALRSQMNPHFIFNCLNAIDNLIQTNQPDKATTYLARFAKLIRYLLESSKNNLVPFFKDFKTLELYLQLEQFRSNNKFSFDLKADVQLLQGDYKVPPLVVQPFVENAIQHGLLNKQEGERKLSVYATLSNNYICYTITDNGVGRIRALEIKDRNNPGHKSYGIGISSERIRLHNRDGRNSVVIQDLNGNDGTGTEVRVKLKI